MSLFDKINKIRTTVNEKIKSNSESKKPATTVGNDRQLKTEKFWIVSIPYCMKNIMKLACTNPDWKLSAAKIVEEDKVDQEIYRYNFINKPVKLVPEPTNEYDPNAIMVMIAGEKVGYFSRGDNIHVGDILKNREIKYISAFISGGPYKIIDDDKHIHKSEYDIKITVKIGYV